VAGADVRVDPRGVGLGDRGDDLPLHEVHVAGLRAAPRTERVRRAVAVVARQHDVADRQPRDATRDLGGHVAQARRPVLVRREPPLHLQARHGDGSAPVVDHRGTDLDALVLRLALTAPADQRVGEEPAVTEAVAAEVDHTGRCEVLRRRPDEVVRHPDGGPRPADLVDVRRLRGRPPVVVRRGAGGEAREHPAVTEHGDGRLRPCPRKVDRGVGDRGGQPLYGGTEALELALAVPPGLPLAQPVALPVALAVRQGTDRDHRDDQPRNKHDTLHEPRLR